MFWRGPQFVDRKDFSTLLGSSASIPSGSRGHAGLFLESLRPYYAGAAVGMGVCAAAGSIYLPWQQERWILLLAAPQVVGYVLLWRYLPRQTHLEQLANYVLQLGWIGLTVVASQSIHPDDSHQGLVLPPICSSFFSTPGPGASRLR